MNDYSHLSHRDDPVECRLPLRVKEMTTPVVKPVDLPRELQFVANVRENHELDPLIRVFQKHPHIRDAVVTALRDEGVRF